MLKATNYWFEYPLWALLARLGRRKRIRIDVLHDADVDVYIATSKDIRGLVCEAESMAELKAEVEKVARDLVAICVPGGSAELLVLEWMV